MTVSRQTFWNWIDPYLQNGAARWTYARTGRGAVAVFDVDSNESLHRMLNEWAEIIPAKFEIHPLIDIAAARNFLSDQTRKKRVAK